MGDGTINKIAIIINGDSEARHLQNVDRSLHVLTDMGYQTYVYSTETPKDQPFSLTLNDPEKFQNLLKGLPTDDDDDVVVYVTGHGGQDKEGPYPVIDRRNPAINHQFLVQLDQIKYGTRTVIVDGCYLGGATKLFLNDPKTVFISSGSQNEVVECQYFAPFFWDDQQNIPDLNHNRQTSWYERYRYAVKQGDNVKQKKEEVEQDHPQFVKTKDYPITDSLPTFPEVAVTMVSSQEELDLQLQRVPKGQTAVLYYSASWCSVCTKFSPDYEYLARDYGGQVLFLKTLSEDLAKAHDISGFPTLQIFKDGKITTLSGLKENEELKKYLPEPPPMVVSEKLETEVRHAWQTMEWSKSKDDHEKSYKHFSDQEWESLKQEFGGEKELKAYLRRVEGDLATESFQKNVERLAGHFLNDNDYDEILSQLEADLDKVDSFPADMADIFYSFLGSSCLRWLKEKAVTLLIDGLDTKNGSLVAEVLENILARTSQEPEWSQEKDVWGVSELQKTKVFDNKPVAVILGVVMAQDTDIPNLGLIAKPLLDLLALSAPQDGDPPRTVYAKQWLGKKAYAVIAKNCEKGSNYYYSKDRQEFKKAIIATAKECEMWKKIDAIASLQKDPLTWLVSIDAPCSLVFPKLPRPDDPKTAYVVHTQLQGYAYYLEFQRQNYDFSLKADLNPIDFVLYQIASVYEAGDEKAHIPDGYGREYNKRWNPFIESIIKTGGFDYLLSFLREKQEPLFQVVAFQGVVKTILDSKNRDQAQREYQKKLEQIASTLPTSHPRSAWAFRYMQTCFGYLSSKRYVALGYM